MELALLKDWLSTILSVIALGGVVWGWLSSGEKQVAKELAEYRAKQAAHDKEVDDSIVSLASRLQRVDLEMQHLPDREQWHRLELAMEKLTGRMTTMDERLSGRIDTLNERLQPVQSIAARLQDLELERAK